MQGATIPRVISGSILLSLLPFLWLFTQVEYVGGWLYAISNVAGFIGAVLLWWQFLLGGRRVLRKLSVDRVALMKTHMFLGIYGTLFVLLHPFLQMVAYGEGLAFVLIPELGSEFALHVTLGKVAFYLFVLIWVTSALLRKKMQYGWWKKIHYLSYPMMFFVFVHALDIGTFLEGYTFVYATWMFFALTFAGMVLMHLAEYFAIGATRYVLTEKKSHAGGVTMYTFSPKGARKVVVEVGQFVYLQLGQMGGAHPFTVMEFDTESGELTFGIKTFGAFTEKLSKLPEGAEVFVDGPYGVFTEEGHNAEPKVILAGGIGVTPFIELVRRYGTDETYMFNANRDVSAVVQRDVLTDVLGKRYVDVVDSIEEGSEGVVSGPMNKDLLLERVPEEVRMQARYFICGPPGFIGAMKTMLEEMGISSGRVYSEEFGF